MHFKTQSESRREREKELEAGRMTKSTEKMEIILQSNISMIILHVSK